MSTASVQLLADSSQIKTATKDLNSLSAAGVKTESAAQSIERQFTKLATASKNAAVSASVFANSLSSVNSDLSEAKSNLELFISDQIKLGNSIDANGNVINKSGQSVDALSNDYKSLQAEYLKTSNQVDLLGDAMQDLNSKTDKNQAAAYEARLRQMALADASKAVNSSFKNQSSTLNKVETEYSRLVAQSNALANGGRNASGALGNLSKNAGMAGIQVQQFVGQIQGGQSALLALSQQGADLGFVLGRAGLGAAIGITATAVSFLLPVLTNAASDVDELRDRIEDLGETSVKTVNQIRFLAQENEKDIGKLSESNQKLGESLVQAREELEAMVSAGTGLDNGQFAVPRSAEENQQRYAAAIKETKERIVELSTEIDTNNQDIIKLSKETAALGDESDKASKKSASLTQSLQAQIIALESGAQAAEVYALTQRAIADGTEEQLPSLIELVNRKYALKAAQEESAQSAKDEAAAAKELESNYQSFLSVLEKAEEAEARKAERQLQSFESLKQQIILQEAQIALDSEQYELRRNLLALGDGASQSQIDEITALTEQMQKLRFEAEILGPTLENSLQNIGVGALDSLSQGLADAITEGESLRDTVGSIANTILNELLTAIIRYAVGAAAQSVISQATATTAAVTSATAITAAATPAAIAMNIATLGAAATAATASSAAAVPAMAGLIAGSGLAGFESGGYTGNIGTKDIAGVVHGREYVVNAKATKENRGALEAMNSGKSIGSTTIVNVNNNASGTEATVNESQDVDGNRIIEVVVANLQSRGKIHRTMTQVTTAANKL